MAGYVAAFAGILVVSFLLGSIPCGVIIGRLFFDADPRDGGSGSIGATNMGRQFGKAAGIGTFALDVAKGAIAVGAARVALFYAGVEAGWPFDLGLVLAVFGSIFGHMFSPWIGWRGGKGISTGLGSLLVAMPPVALTILAVFIVVVAFTRIVSAGSVAAATALPFSACFFYWGSLPIIALSAVVCVGVDFAHRDNIKRLVAGTEPKFSFHKEDDDGREGGRDA